MEKGGSMNLDSTATIDNAIGDFPCGVIRFTMERFPHLTYMNDYMKELLGTTAENEEKLDYIENNIYFMFPFEERDNVRVKLREARIKETPVSLETEVSCCDGSRKTLLGWVGTKVLKTGVEYKGIFFEPEHKAKEDAEEKNRRLKKAITDAYDVAFEFALEDRTVKCIHDKYHIMPDSVTRLRIVLDDGLKYFCDNALDAEDRARMMEFIKSFRRSGDDPDEIPEAGHIEFTVINGKKPLRCMATVIYLDSRNGIFCFNILETEEEQHLEKSRRAGENPMKNRVFIRTFGYFEIFVDGEPIPFKSRKAKELLALLVDRRGGFVTSREAISCLWEDENADDKTMSRLRKVFMRLKDELSKYGIENILISVRGKRRIDTGKVRCDLYDFLDGVPGSDNLYRGVYMTNYSWGEMTAAELDGISYGEE